jgi:hypothetical protein
MADEPERQNGASPGKARSGSLVWLILLGAIVVVLGLATAFLLGRTTAPRSDTPRVAAQGPSAPANQVAPPARSQALGTPAPAAAAGAANADFLITDRLLARPRAYDDFQADPVTPSVCIGGTLRIANVASRRVGLIDTPDESDASVELGFVEPGGVFTLEPQEVGTFFISAAGTDGLLFRYSARRCPAPPR